MEHHLDENGDWLKDVWNSSNGIGRIIGLQFSTLHPSEQLLFLDVALYNKDFDDSILACFGAHPHVFNDYLIVWLSKLHDETIGSMNRKLSTILSLVARLSLYRRTPEVYCLPFISILVESAACLVAI